MDYYIFKHDIYGFEDHKFEAFVEIFSDEESARNYFKVKKQIIIQDYLERSGYNTLDDLLGNEFCYHDFENTVDNLPYMFLDYYDIRKDEYSFDRIVIQKKTVMSFDLSSI